MELVVATILFFIILLVAIVALLISLRSGNASGFKDIAARMQQMEQELSQLRKQLDEGALKAPEPVSESPVKPAPQPDIPPLPVFEKPIPQPPVFEQAKPQPAFDQPKPQPVPGNIERINTPITPPKPPVTFPPPPPKKAASQRTFFERNPDLEKFIGENLISKIGIAILVLAIGFFVKYAIDNNWIGPVGRVGVGILCGAVLILFAHRLRKNFKAFSSVLVGGGLAVFYFTITLAFHEFHLFSQPVAFAILIVITIFAVVLSMLYDREELAIIALIGGFLSPFMVSTGQANYNALFIYLVILNAGLLIIAYNKIWRILNILSFGLTIIVAASVIYTLTKTTYHTGLIYVSIFYLMYLCINIAYNVRQSKIFIASDFCILLVNTALYFAAGLYLLTQMGLDQYRGLFCIILGAVNLILSFVLFRNQKADANVLYLLIGITLTLISLTAPIQLHGHYITLFWSAEAVLLLWLHKKSGIKLMRLTSALLWLAMLFSLLMDWWEVYLYDNVKLIVIANKGFVTTLCAGISSYVLFVLGNDEKDVLKNFFIKKSAFRITAFILFYLAGYLEVNYQINRYYPGNGLNVIYLSLYSSVFLAVLNYFVLKQKQYLLCFGLSVALLFVHLFLSNAFFETQSSMLYYHRPSSGHMLAHWVDVIFMAIVIYQLVLATIASFDEPTKKIIAWFIFAGVTAFLSIEFCLASNSIFYKHGDNLAHLELIYVKTALPVIWGLLSFVIMWLGMSKKIRTFRIISLSLFTLTLLKLFIFDISNIPAAGKIVAFFCLGVLLLIISFMYQKVKQIIVDDEKPEDE